VSRKQLRSKQGRGIARLAVLAAALVACVAPPAGATTIERVVSPGGIEAWLVHESAVPLIAVDFAFVGGAIQDPPGKAGTSVMVASLLDEGAGDLDSQAFHQRLERKAVELNLETERDAIRGSLRTLTENRDEAFDDLRLSLTAPRFDPAAVEIIRGQVLSLVRRAATNPADMARQRWWEIAFADHPYGRPANGTSESVPTITADDLKAYTRRVLARENLKVAVVGDIDAEAVKAMLDRVFGALPAKAELATVASVSPQGLGRRVVIKVDVPQAVVAFGGAGIARKDPDFMAAYIVNHILGGGAFSSRLYQEVREKRGLAYSVHSNIFPYQHGAVFVGSVATQNEAVAQSLAVIEGELKRLAEEGPSAEELAGAKSYLTGAYALRFESSSSIANQLLWIQIEDLGIDYVDRRNELVEQVSLDNIKRVAKRLIEADRLITTIVGKPVELKPKEAPS
jgi:zinc protease